MRITTIGSGTGAPSATRVSAAHLVEAGDVRLLLDCGSGSVHRMAELGIDWMGITHVAITHFHADHISDVATLFYAWRYGAIPFRTAPVDIIGPPGFAELFRQMGALYGSDMGALGYTVRTGELEAGATVALSPHVSLTSRKVPHTDESVAYSVVAHGSRLVYSGDTAFDPTLAEWARGCDVLLLECSLPGELAVATHMTPEQCAEFAEIAQPGALALTHIYPPLDKMDVKSIVRARYGGPVSIAYDGWMIKSGE